MNEKAKTRVLGISLLVAIVIAVVLASLTGCGEPETATEYAPSAPMETAVATEEWHPKYWVITEIVDGQSINCIISKYWATCDWDEGY